MSHSCPKGEKHEIGLCLGSNLGRRLANLRAARNMILRIKGVAFVAQSPVYRTDPVDMHGEKDPASFLNAVLVIATGQDPLSLMARFKRVEAELGRPSRHAVNASRTIDIDIIYCGRLEMDSAVLHLPHPLWKTRRFVARPLADVRPAMRLPGYDGTVEDALLSLPAGPKVVLYRRDW